MEKILKGKVIQGEGQGRTIGYPTANIDRRYFSTHPVPDGVWACRVKVLKHAPFRKLVLSGAGSIKSKVHKVIGIDKWYEGVAVIGMKDKKREGKKVEIHLLNFKRNIYGWYIVAVAIKRLRKLKKFDGVPELIKQVKRDIATARKIILK